MDLVRPRLLQPQPVDIEGHKNLRRAFFHDSPHLLDEFEQQGSDCKKVSMGDAKRRREGEIIILHALMPLQRFEPPIAVMIFDKRRAWGKIGAAGSHDNAARRL